MVSDITRAQQFYEGGADRPLAERVHHTWWQRMRPLQPMPDFDKPIGPARSAVQAFINDSRWVVVCPDCNSAQVVSPDDPRFLCIECVNETIGGRWRPAMFPSNLEALEQALMERPRRINRNWRPGESVASLRSEAMDQARPSIPRLEDLAESDQQRLDEAWLDYNQGVATELPVVEWADAERTEPKIRWPKGKKGAR